MVVSVMGDELLDRRKETVRNDPFVRQAGKITENAKHQLMMAVEADDVRESWRLMRVFSRAVVLREDAEDEVRVRLGLLVQHEAARRKLIRRADLAEPLGAERAPGPVATLLTRAANWLARLAAACADRGSQDRGYRSVGPSSGAGAGPSGAGAGP